MLGSLNLRPSSCVQSGASKDPGRVRAPWQHHNDMKTFWGWRTSDPAFRKINIIKDYGAMVCIYIYIIYIIHVSLHLYAVRLKRRFHVTVSELFLLPYIHCGHSDTVPCHTCLHVTDGLVDHHSQRVQLKQTAGNRSTRHF